MCGRAIFKALFAPLDALCSFVCGTKLLNKLPALLIVHGPTDFIIFAGANESLATTTLSFRIKIAYRNGADRNSRPHSSRMQGLNNNLYWAV